MIIWPAALCFISGFFVRIFRYWYLLRSFRFSLVAIACAVFFSTAVTILVGMPMVGETVKWLLLGAVFSACLIPALVSILYTRLFDFLVISLFLWIFHSEVPTLLPWIGLTIAITGLLLAILMILPLLFKQGASFFLKRWHHPFSSKLLDKTIAAKNQILSLKLAQMDSVVLTFLLTILVWVCEGGALYFLLKQGNVEMVQAGMVQGILRHFIHIIPMAGTGAAHIDSVLKQFQYESFEIPIFFCAIVCAIISLQRWIMQKKV